MRLFRRDLKTRNSGLALLSMCSIIMLAYVWYLGGLGPNLTPKEVLMQQVFSEHLPLHLHQGPKAAQSIVPVTVQHSKMPPRSKHPDTSPVCPVGQAVWHTSPRPSKPSPCSAPSQPSWYSSQLGACMRVFVSIHVGCIHLPPTHMPLISPSIRAHISDGLTMSPSTYGYVNDYNGRT